MRWSPGPRAVSDVLSPSDVGGGLPVAICGTTEEGVHGAVEGMKEIGSGKVAGCKADVSKSEDVENLFSFVSKEFGGLDISSTMPAWGFFERRRDTVSGGMGPYD